MSCDIATLDDHRDIWTYGFLWCRACLRGDVSVWAVTTPLKDMECAGCHGRGLVDVGFLLEEDQEA